MADISKITLPSGSEYNIKDSVARAAAATMIGATSSTAGTGGTVPIPAAGDQDKFLRADGTWADGGHPMVVLVYGTSTWQEFIDAYNGHYIVYCRTGGRMAFMAYVNKDGVNPTEVEFQYYRSVSSKSDTQQGDETYIYKLTNANGGTWTTQTRQNYTRVIAGTNIKSTYSSQKITLDLDVNNETAAAGGTTLSLVTTGEKDTWNNKVDSSDVGVSVASLTSGKVPDSQIPDSVHDVLEYSSSSSFPAAGEEGKLYVDQSSNLTYRWDETEYVQVGGSSVPVMTGSTSSIDGATGTVPVPLAGDQSKYLKGDGTWGTIPQYQPFDGATSSDAGTSGLVPAPSAGDQSKYLKANGTWGLPANAKLVTFNLDQVTNTNGTYTHTTTVSGVTADMKAIKLDISNPEVFGADIQIETGSNSVTLTCADVSGTSDVMVSLLLEGSLNTMTSAEYDALNTRVPAPTPSDRFMFLRGDGTWNNISIPPMAGATASNPGGSGMVPAPSAGDQNKLLQGDGTWTDTINTGRKPNTVVGINSTAEGFKTTASEMCSHAEGYYTTASGQHSHTEGANTTASQSYSHAEGTHTTASGVGSHAEGYYTTASGHNSHAEGFYTTSSGDNSHAEGSYTTANHWSQHVFGERNIIDSSTESSQFRGNYVEIVGNGTSDSARSNARTLDWNGNEWLAGDLTVNGSSSGISVVNRVLTPNAAIAIPSSSASYDLPGLTANHVVVAWRFSSSAENSPPCDITVTTYSGYFTITVSNGTTSETFQPVFAVPFGIAATTH